MLFVLIYVTKNSLSRAESFVFLVFFSGSAINYTIPPFSSFVNIDLKSTFFVANLFTFAPKSIIFIANERTHFYKA